MSLSSIGSSTSVAASTFVPASSTSQAASGTDVASTSGTPGTGRFASAVSDAFASIGVPLDGTSSTATADAATTDGSDALGSFVQSLFAALHGQSAGATSAPADAPGTVASTRRGDHVPHAHHGHGGKLETDLQSLITELQSSNGTTASSPDAGTISTTSSTTTDSTLATLENRFDALLATSGTTTGGSASLAGFLQTLAAGLHGAPPTGNVVSTEA